MPSLLAVLGLDLSNFSRGLDQATGEARSKGQGIGRSLGVGMNAGTFAAAAATAALAYEVRQIKKLLDEADEIKAGSARLGVGTGTFQDLKFAAEKGKTSVEALYGAYRKLAATGQEAIKGNRDLMAEFNQLGISMADLNRLTPDEVFHKIANRMEGATVSAADLAAMIKTMGRGADELVPAMRSGLFSGASPFKLSKQDLDYLERFKGTVGMLGNAAIATGKALGMLVVKGEVLWSDATGFTKLYNYLFGAFRGKKFDPSGVSLNDSILAEAATAKEAEDQRKAALIEEHHQRERLVHLIERQRELNTKFFEGGMTATAKLANLEARRIALLKETFDLTTAQGAADAQERNNKLTEVNTEMQTLLTAEMTSLRRSHPEVNSLQRAGGYAGPADRNYTLMHEIAQHVKTIAGRTATEKRITIGGF